MVIVRGLPCGALELLPGRRLRLDGREGAWPEIAWPAQLAAGDARMALQQSLGLLDALAAGGWADARRDRDEREGSNPAASWAWSCAYSGFPDAAAAAHGLEFTAAEILADRRARLTLDTEGL